MKAKKFKLRSEIALTRAGADLNILNLNSADKLLTLSGTSVVMFEHLKSGKPFELIIDHLIQEYDVDRKKLEEDLTKLIISLLYHKIIELTP